MLAADKKLLVMFMGGEYFSHFSVKFLRDDFLTFYRAEGLIGGVLSSIHNMMVKMVVDFSGNFHMRHSYGTGERAKRASLDDEDTSDESRDGRLHPTTLN